MVCYSKLTEVQKKMLFEAKYVRLCLILNDVWRFKDKNWKEGWNPAGFESMTSLLQGVYCTAVLLLMSNTLVLSRNLIISLNTRISFSLWNLDNSNTSSRKLMVNIKRRKTNIMERNESCTTEQQQPKAKIKSLIRGGTSLALGLKGRAIHWLLNILYIIIIYQEVKQV